MTEISGQPIVNRSDSVAATNLRTQDLLFNPITSTASISLPNVIINSQNVSGSSNLNFGGAFTTSGRTITAAGSGVFAPLGFVNVLVSGNAVVIPYFAV